MGWHVKSGVNLVASPYNVRSDVLEFISANESVVLEIFNPESVEL